MWDNMVDTNQDSLQDGEPEKKKKPSPKKAVKTKDNTGNAKNLAVKKEAAPPIKTHGPAKASTPAKGQFITKIRKFLKGAWGELKKVHWPTRSQIIAYTGVVLVAVSIVAVMIFLMDTVLSKSLEFIIPK